MPAFGKMYDEGKLKDRDLYAINSNFLGFSRAVDQGLLVKKAKGEYIWADNIRPLGKQWHDLMVKFI